MYKLKCLQLYRSGKYPMFVKFLGEQRHIPSYFENANVLYTHVTVYKHAKYHAILDNYMLRVIDCQLGEFTL